MSFELIKTGDYPLHLDRIDEVGTTPGLQRGKVTSVMRAMPKGTFAFSVSFGKSIARMTGDGTLMPNPKKASIDKNDESVVLGLAEPTLSFEEAATLTGLSEELESVTIAGSAPANKRGPHGLIRAGLMLIVAPGGVGKSPLAHHLAGYDVAQYAVVRAGEPLAGYTANRDRIAKALAQAMYNCSDVVLDSIKDLLSSSGGGAMKGGISREALLDLSSWASTAASLGVTLYVPLNPSSKELIDQMIEVAASNATTVFSNHGGTSAWAWTARTGEGLPRESGTYEFKTTGRGVQVSSLSPDGGIEMRADPTKTVNLRGILSRTQSNV